MKKLTTMHALKATSAGLLLIAAAAQAQYVWVDAKGVKQFSDRAPPPEVPVKNILKSPSPVKPSLEPVDAVDTAKAAKAQVKADEPSLADREAEYRKRMTAKAEADKEAAEKAAIQAQRAVACNAARAARAQLDNGRRLRGPDGSFLGDAERAQQAARTDAILRDCARG